MASTDARVFPRKNVAYRHTFFIIDSTGLLVSGAAGLDSEISKDGGAFTDCINEATEISGGGLYFIDLTSAEMDADTVALKIKTTTVDALTMPIILYPEELGDIRSQLDLTQTVNDVGGVANTLGGIFSLLRALANGKMTIASAVMKLFGQDDTTQIGVDRTVSGTVPSDTTRQ